MRKNLISRWGWACIAAMALIASYLCPDIYEAKCVFAYWPGKIRVNGDGSVAPAGFHVGNHPGGEAVIHQALAFTESDVFRADVVKRFLNGSHVDSPPSDLITIVKRGRLSVSGMGMPVVELRIRSGSPRTCAGILSAYMEELSQAALSQERACGMVVDDTEEQGPVHVLQMDRRGHWTGKSLPRIHTDP